MSLTFHWFLPTTGDSRHVVGGGHGSTPARRATTGRPRWSTWARSPGPPSSSVSSAP